MNKKNIQVNRVFRIDGKEVHLNELSPNEQEEILKRFNHDMTERELYAFTGLTVEEYAQEFIKSLNIKD